MLLLFLLFNVSFADERYKDLFDTKLDKEKYALSKNIYNGHKQLSRQTARMSVDHFNRWCFSKQRTNGEYDFSLKNLEDIYKNCFEELNKTKCENNEKSEICKIKNSLKNNTKKISSINKMVPKDQEENSENKDCKIDISGANKWISSKGKFCTMALVPMVCPKNKKKFTASNGCVAEYHRRFGWQ